MIRRRFFDRKHTIKTDFHESEINAEEVQWLWYPYIPLGKLTILQGDPGEGKTSFILAVLAALTRGEPLPECERAAEPMNVIYQTAEDGLADTIKPRLESTKLLHHKDGGVQFYHMVQSFPRGADVDPRAAHEAARLLAGYFEGCEVLVCTHVDREHIHSHCIINSINFETGKKVHMADEQIQELRVRNDQICEELGLPKFQRDEQKRSRGMSNAEYYTASKGESWKFELMRVIDECMRYAGSREEFLALLRSEGYDATWTDSRKNITYTTPDGRKCRDNKLHIEKYLKGNMEAEFGYRTENDNTRNLQKLPAPQEQDPQVYLRHIRYLRLSA